ncbi:flagellar hook-length control protein FliK [Neobacillus vireti]|uniref:flagellar hook-length control protein FliK n=1 Tax=Neobacillus vireti TaxID=220686 RepID=UPI0030002D7C
MIQLSGIQNNLTNQTGKVTAKEGEQASGFEALLQLIGQVQGQRQEEDTVPFGFINQLVQPPYQLQNALTGTNLHQVEEGIVQVQVVPNIKNGKQTSEIPLFQSNIKNLAAVNGKTGEMQPEVATIFQEPLTGEFVKETGIVTQKVAAVEEFNQKELTDMNQTGRNSLVDDFTMVHSTPTNQPNLSSEKAGSVQTLQANQFDQEITKFLQSSIHVTGLEDGIEAAFTLAPKHLGKVDVKVTIQDGQVTAEFLTSTPLGKDLLETHVQTLRSALETQGLQVGKIDITQQSTTASNFLGHFSQKGDSQARQGQQDSRRRHEQPIIQTQEEYRNYVNESGWVSKINTTA